MKATSFSATVAGLFLNHRISDGSGRDGAGIINLEGKIQMTNMIRQGTLFTRLTLALILLLGPNLQGAGHTGPAKDFTIVVLPDTQNYASSDGGGTPEIFQAQTQWIADNRDALNIVYVAHVGDCVNHADREEEWKAADAAFRKLEGSAPIPYGIAVGNHDKYIYRSRPVLIDGVHIETTQLYNRYFGLHRVQDRPWFGENYGPNNDNFYHLVSAGGLDFILLYFEFAAGSDVLGWADLILEKYRDRRAIVVTHTLLENDGSFNLQGRAIHNALKHRPNLFLMLCGHRVGRGTKEGHLSRQLHLYDPGQLPRPGKRWKRLVANHDLFPLPEPDPSEDLFTHTGEVRDRCRQSIQSRLSDVVGLDTRNPKGKCARIC